MLGQIGDKSFELLDDLLLILLSEFGNTGESLLGELFRNLLRLLLLAAGLESLLDLIKSLFVLKQTLNFSLKLLRKNSLVILFGHGLDVDGVVEVPEQSVDSLGLLLGCFLGVLGRLLLRLFSLGLNRLEVPELVLVDSLVGDLNLPEYPSSSGDLAKRSNQFLNLGGGARRLGIFLGWGGCVLGDSGGGDGFFGDGHRKGNAKKSLKV